jgi:hypothetical protein
LADIQELRQLQAFLKKNEVAFATNVGA